MYLSKIDMPPLSRKTVKILSDLYTAHQMVMGGFKKYDAEESGRILYRLEPERYDETYRVLVQSESEPDWSHLSPYVEIDLKQWESRLQEGRRYRFRLRANPIVTRQGRRFGLIGESDQRRWLERKDLGLSWIDYHVIDEGHRTSWKIGRPIYYRSVVYEGIVEVVVHKKALAALYGGIGPAKGFGFGLLSLARI